MQLAVPITRGPAEDDTSTAIHSDVSEASNSSKDLFVPARRMAVETKRGGSTPLKLKVNFSRAFIYLAFKFFSATQP